MTYATRRRGVLDDFYAEDPMAERIYLLRNVETAKGALLWRRPTE